MAVITWRLGEAFLLGLRGFLCVCVFFFFLGGGGGWRVEGAGAGLRLRAKVLIGPKHRRA